MRERGRERKKKGGGGGGGEREMVRGGGIKTAKDKEGEEGRE